ncbi:MAG: hypothetical protein AB1477_04570 [Acidobacteriota bacterium]|jgi:hypothetical protein
MDKNHEFTPQSRQIQSILSRFLASVPQNETGGPHLEDDFLSAFIEGSLNDYESEAAIGHLSECGFCRNTTAELIRLDYQLAEIQEREISQPVSEPTRISDVLNRLFSQIFGPAENVVFAHQDPKPEDSDQNTTDPHKKKEK